MPLVEKCSLLKAHLYEGPKVEFLYRVNDFDIKIYEVENILTPSEWYVNRVANIMDK